MLLYSWIIKKSTYKNEFYEAKLYYIYKYFSQIEHKQFVNINLTKIVVISKNDSN